MGTDVIGGPHDFLPPRSAEFQKLWWWPCLNDVFTFLTEVGNAGRVVNTGTSSVNSEYVTALNTYVIFYLFLVNIIGDCHENKYI